MQILVEEDIMAWWFKFGLKYRERWFYKPIWGCHRCWAGQVAFWSYLYLVFFEGRRYFLPEHIFFVCLTILLVIIFVKLYKSFEKIK